MKGNRDPHIYGYLINLNYLIFPRSGVFTNYFRLFIIHFPQSVPSVSPFPRFFYPSFICHSSNS